MNATIGVQRLFSQYGGLPRIIKTIPVKYSDHGGCYCAACAHDALFDDDLDSIEIFLPAGYEERCDLCEQRFAGPA